MLSSQLLELARQMLPAEKDPLEDSKARRAISTAYYALFHLLAESLAEQFPDVRGNILKFRLQRLLNHKDVKAICDQLGNGKLPPFLKDVVSSVPEEAKLFGSYFVELHAQRHTADYDPSIRQDAYSASNVLISASVAFDLWTALRGTPLGAAISVAFLVSAQYKGR